MNKTNIFWLFLVLPLILAGCEKSPPPATALKSTPPDEEQTKVIFNSKWPYIDAHSDILAQPQSSLSRNYYVVFDGSGSMSDSNCAGNSTKADVGKAALVAFSKSVPLNDNLGLLVFDGKGISERVPLGKNNRSQFTEEVMAVQPSSVTPLKTAIQKAYNALTEQAVRQQGYGEYHLIVVTDGDASSGEDPQSIVDRILAESPVIIHTIGFCIGQNHALNQPGRIVYKSAMNANELMTGLQDVLAESKEFVPTTFQ